MKRGTVVTIQRSWSSDVPAGATGVVLKRMEDGYAIEVTGNSTDAKGRRTHETRCLFFSADELSVSLTGEGRHDLTLPSL